MIKKKIEAELRTVRTIEYEGRMYIDMNDILGEMIPGLAGLFTRDSLFSKKPKQQD